MTIPTLTLALVIAFLYGTLYHLLRDGGFWRLILYLILSAIGFMAGHFIGTWQGWIILPLGEIDLGAASLGSLIILVIGDWLSRIEGSPQSTV